MWYNNKPIIVVIALFVITWYSFAILASSTVSSYSDWVPNTFTNGQKATICTCGLSPECDKPWVVWGYIVQTASGDDTPLLCVILNNVRDEPLEEDPSTGVSPSLVTSVETLSKYLKYHIYYNDSLHMRDVRSNRSQQIITGFKNSSTGDNLVYDYQTHRLVINNNQYWTTNGSPLLRVEVLRTFRIYSSEYFINGLKYVYRGVIRSQNFSCFNVNGRLKVVPTVFHLLN